MLNYFGTDGIRGKYNHELTCDTAYNLGIALAAESGGGIVLVGRDTRLSGSKLLSALCQGANAGGANIINIGILPTNAVAHFTRRFGADYGVMISASHNPPQDNGLKVFDKYGVKLCRQKQEELSAIMYAQNTHFPSQNAFEPEFDDIENLYITDLLNAVSVDLDGVRVALDCCYGAAYKSAKTLFLRSGASVKAYCNFADGEKINVGCGATVPEFLEARLALLPCDLGFAFDGDADRLAVFQHGKFVPNDNVFYALVKYYAQNRLLAKSAVVGTHLTNSGLEKAVNSLGISLLRSEVGDERVFNLMSVQGANLGGEQSGHYLMSDFATGSDALLNALFIAKIYKECGSLFDYTRELELAPTLSQNLEFDRERLKALVDSGAIEGAKTAFAQKFPACRLVLRPSGTEPLLRIFIEGEEKMLPTALDYLKTLL